MWPAFPASDYYGPSAPTRRHQPATRLPCDRRSGRGGGRRVGSHVHSRFVRQGRCPAMPLRHRHAYPAALQRGLPAGDINRRRSSPPASAGAHRNPAQIRQVRAGGLLLRGVRTLVPHVHLPVTLAGPRSSDGAGPSRRCQGCFQPIRRVPASRPTLSFTGPLRRAGGGVLSPPHDSRAPRGARCRSSTTRSGGRVRKLELLIRRLASFLAAVDPVLLQPVVDRGLGHPERDRELSNTRARPSELDHRRRTSNE